MGRASRLADHAPVQSEEASSMSVIVALPADGDRPTWIGSDSMVHAGSLRLTGRKWVVQGPWAVGVAGHLRTVNLIEQHAGDLFTDVADAFDFSCRMRAVLQQDGYQDAEDGRGPVELGQSFLLARQSGVWTIGNDFSVIRIPAGQLWAEGTGRELALGAAHALMAVRPRPSESEIVRAAIEAAIAFDSSCGGPVWIEQLAGSGGEPRAAGRIP